MAFTFGFYNSVNYDRMYDATPFSHIFDGIINDGVYMTVGNRFMVKEVTNRENCVVVGSGRAWFDRTWNWNDADIYMDAPLSEVILDRIDALVIDVNYMEDYRENQIMWVKGIPSSDPQRPTLIKSEGHNQYPLAYVFREKNTNDITTADITNMVGTSDCPFVTGVLETMDIDDLVAQWGAQWEEYVLKYGKEAEEWQAERRAELQAFYDEYVLQLNEYQTQLGEWTEEKKEIFNNFYEEFQNTTLEFQNKSQQEYNEWFDRYKTVINENAAANLLTEIDKNAEIEFNRFYGTYNSVTTIDSSSGKDIITSTSDEAVSVTYFDSLTTGDIITTEVTPNTGKYNYRKITTITTENGVDTISTTYEKILKEDQGESGGEENGDGNETNSSEGSDI